MRSSDVKLNVYHCSSVISALEKALHVMVFMLPRYTTLLSLFMRSMIGRLLCSCSSATT